MPGWDIQGYKIVHEVSVEDAAKKKLEEMKVVDQNQESIKNPGREWSESQFGEWAHILDGPQIDGSMIVINGSNNFYWVIHEDHKWYRPIKNGFSPAGELPPISVSMKAGHRFMEDDYISLRAHLTTLTSFVNRRDP